MPAFFGCPKRTQHIHGWQQVKIYEFICAIHRCIMFFLEKKNWAALTHERHTFNLCMCHSWPSAMKSWKKKNWAALTHEWHTFNLCMCHSWPSAMKSWKKKNWAALTHEWYTFNLCVCHSWPSAMKSWKKKKIGQH